MTKLFNVTGLLLFLWQIFPVISSSGQNSVSDTSFLTKSRAQAYALYTEKIAEQSPLVNGSEYKEYLTVPELTTGIPYFISDDWIDGNVFYDSALYSNVPLMYDEVTDKLIIEQPFSHYKLELISEKVNYFEISGHTFLRIVRAKSDSTISTGFYDVLYDGKTKAYVKRLKQVIETTQPGGVLINYLDTKRYLLWKDNIYYPVSRKSSVMKVFEDKRKLLRKLVRDHSSEIDFHNNREKSIALIARLYDETEK
jgi:hypothetical protein